MSGIEDLVEPGPEEIRLACLLALLGPHESLPSSFDGSRESRAAGLIKVPEKLSTADAIRQTRMPPKRQDSCTIRGLGILHGRLCRRGSAACAGAPPRTHNELLTFLTP